MVMPDTDEITKDLAAFEAMRAELEAHSHSKWAVFHAAALVDVYDTFETAASQAVAKFGRGPYLIRQIGAPQFTMPASVAYRIG